MAAEALASKANFGRLKGIQLADAEIMYQRRREKLEKKFAPAAPAPAEKAEKPAPAAAPVEAPAAAPVEAPAAKPAPAAKKAPSAPRRRARKAVVADSSESSES